MVLSHSTKFDRANDEAFMPLKVSDKLESTDKPTISFEYFPPKTEAGVENLHKRMSAMCDMKPIWIDVTFGAGGSTTERTLEICESAVKKYGVDVMMHLTCTNMKRSDLDVILDRIKQAGIRNILALRGDPPADSSEWTQCEGGFSHAVDLVRYIRSQHGDYFCIGVAGYPEGHADCESIEKDLGYLKAKVEAGADLIVTQLFYDNKHYFEFVRRVRDMGVNVPVIPGVMPILSYAGLKRMTTMCRVELPNDIDRAVEAIKDDENRVKEFGIELATQMCADLIKRGAPGVHIYTMNHEDNVREIVKGIAPILPAQHVEWLTSA
jgi:methylenetetrahydrofolate reductase (NADPH)